ncbi:MULTISPECIES: LysR family transcriptional regulator [Agrobacterium tumefaciens complex]|uniref:LysR family transcriptional regulator n=1 Tax=Agrobacterium tumefaciens complex TaxID=1183400 RepID=UPI0001FC21C8|nr:MULTISPECIES: LysR family transcriptional regulator [Agrobacterium tumefaciens complex]ADY67811.1 transcriptional regulator, LysR family [Agrobacterium tumefaciens]KAB0459226.1 LysR family transcriptional regulator [Agrobacterium tumefaciens]KWT75577.1 LysR family transcriptional regulator [Agrobacterium radiobacter]NIB11642.1 LysR family transcriptional regulator [Agrobacterium radiobacter]OOO33299.1 LysR family transcriptional regulator [Agrobacterium radiobacter]
MTELNSRRLEIDALRALCAIRHHGGITRAAAALGLSQSAISHKIKRLEISLDCELLGRKSGGPMFTAAGADLLDYAGRILGLHDEALLSLSKTPLAGRLLLGLTEDTACTDLARILGRFKRLHPNVAVRTKVRMSTVLRAMLEGGELDAAIVQVFSHEVRPSDVVLYKEGLHWVKHPELMIRQGEPIPFVSFDDKCFYRQWAFDIGQENAVLKTVFECSSAAGIVSAVNAAMGVALLSDRHIRGEMQIMNDRLPAPPSLAYVIRRARKTRNPALDSLVGEIERDTGRQGGLALTA